MKSTFLRPLMVASALVAATGLLPSVALADEGNFSIDGMPKTLTADQIAALQAAQAKHLAAEIAEINAALKAGKITQTQADALIAKENAEAARDAARLAALPALQIGEAAARKAVADAKAAGTTLTLAQIEKAEADAVKAALTAGTITQSAADAFAANEAIESARAIAHAAERQAVADAKAAGTPITAQLITDAQKKALDAAVAAGTTTAAAAAVVAAHAAEEEALELAQHTARDAAIAQGTVHVESAIHGH